MITFKKLGSLKRPNKQKGFSLIQISMALVVSGMMATYLIDMEIREDRRNDFQTLGNLISEHSRAVAEWSADQGGAAVPGTYTGTNWLKSNANCGITTGGSKAYLPCGFDFLSVKFGGQPQTRVTNVGGITTAITTWPAVTTGGVPESIGVGIAVEQAEANARNTLEGVVLYTEQNTGVITASVNVNNGTGIYVKRTGDDMTGDLGLGGNDINNVGIMNANRGQFGVVTTTGNVAVGGDLAARNITARSNVTALGNVVATGDVRGRFTYTQRVYDSNNTAYYSDPSSRSILNTADIGSIRDLNNTSFTLDPSGTSNVKNISSENVDVSGFLKLSKVVIEGGACTTNGTLARLSSGKAVSCTNKKWEIINGNPTYSYCNSKTLTKYTFQYYPPNRTNYMYHVFNTTTTFPNTSVGIQASYTQTYTQPAQCNGYYPMNGFTATVTTEYTCQPDGSFKLEPKKESFTTLTIDCGIDPG